VKISDLSELAVRNLRESVLRNSLTTVGISVGVASLVAMLSLGTGLQQMFTRRLAKSGLFDTVVVTRQDSGRMGSNDERNASNPAEIRALDEPARREMEKLPNVAEAYPDIRFRTDLRFDDKTHPTVVSALPQSAKSNDAFDGMQGSFFSSDAAPEAILQKSFAEELLGKKPALGAPEPDVADLAKPLLGKELTMVYPQREALTHPPLQASDAESVASVAGAEYSVFFREQKLKIVGICDLDPESMRGPMRGRLFIPLKLAESQHIIADLREVSNAGNEPVYGSISVRVKDPSRVQGVEDAIKKMGFSTFSILDASRSLQQVFKVLFAFLGIFGSLALTVASIGIVNTLVMAILERRREIGIMKSIGASDSDVWMLFFAEAGVMGVLGGIVGVIFGWAIGQVINFGTNIYLKRQSIPPEHFWAVPWWLAVGAIIFAVIVSLFSGLYPASRAARLDPVQALRYE
jgi:putative ABC transport system permease protein